MKTILTITIFFLSSAYGQTPDTVKIPVNCECFIETPLTMPSGDNDHIETPLTMPSGDTTPSLPTNDHYLHFQIGLGNIVTNGVRYKGVELQSVKYLTGSTKYPFLIGALNYHYKGIYAGWSTEGFSVGAEYNKGNFGIRGGMAGKYGYIAATFSRLPEQTKLTRKTLEIGLQVISGAADAFNQAISQHHYLRGSQFSDPELSTWNKYKADHITPRFPGSTTYLVSFTDGYHLSRLIEHAANYTTIALCLTDFKENWKNALLNSLILWGTNRLSFEYFYNRFK
jgi:hypothetical protein